MAAVGEASDVIDLDSGLAAPEGPMPCSSSSDLPVAATSWNGSVGWLLAGVDAFQVGDHLGSRGPGRALRRSS